MIAKVEALMTTGSRRGPRAGHERDRPPVRPAAAVPRLTYLLNTAESEAET